MCVLGVGGGGGGGRGGWDGGERRREKKQKEVTNVVSLVKIGGNFTLRYIDDFVRTFKGPFYI